jgi:2,3-bisphosphoglycerate-dependent phosphoglycerate mutase
VISTHGNLLALILKHFNPDVGYTFWYTLTMPDIYQLECVDGNQIHLTRRWGEVDDQILTK